MRWMDNIHKWSGLTTKELNKACRDRNGWRRLTYVGAQSAMGRASAKKFYQVIVNLDPNVTRRNLRNK